VKRCDGSIVRNANLMLCTGVRAADQINELGPFGSLLCMVALRAKHKETCVLLGIEKRLAIIAM
jgi:hypothetical protein